MSFLPPTPVAPGTAPAVAALIEPPKVQPNPFVKEAPATFLHPVISHAPSFSETVRKADRHYVEGKKLFLEGKTEEARREFDRAMDALLDASDASDRAQVERKFEELVRAIHRYDVNEETGADGDNPVFDQSPLEALLEMTFPVDPKLKNKVVEEVRATASQLPLTVNEAVLSYVNFFSGERGRRILLHGLRRSGRYRHMISRVLNEEGVPQELMMLAQAESAFLPRAMSRKAAGGMWQFLKATGREYDLKQTAATDDRFDPEKATRAAARHLRDLYTQFGDWHLAMAAYNCGPGCVDRAVSRTGYADFWVLREKNALPKETRNYVPAILAMTIVVKNPEHYGLEEVELDAPLEYESVELRAATNVFLIADAAERPVTEIRELNPALLKSVAPAGYEMRVPKGTASMVLEAFESVPESRRASWRLHRVGAGETLGVIAKRYNTPVSALASANGGSALETPEAGDVLVIPAAYKEPVVKKAVRKPSGKATRTTARAKAGRGKSSVSASKGTTQKGFRKSGSMRAQR
ncbi:MAG: transglycosylase SLT domain-containing protein [Bryobacteraceae bacterium]|nr:transglycosylase SLT domain-containing protein [Bryobacteraceae bacterium]